MSGANFDNLNYFILISNCTEIKYRGVTTILFWSELCNYCKYLQVHAVAQLVEALRYKSEGRGFDSQWFHWIY